MAKVYLRSVQNRALEQDCFDKVLSPVVIGPNGKLANVHELNMVSVNAPNEAGYTPFQAAIAARDLDALASVICNPGFRFEPNLKTYNTPRRGLTEHCEKTRLFRLPKPMDEVEEVTFMRFLREIEQMHIDLSENSKEDRADYLDKVKAVFIESTLCRVHDALKGVDPNINASKLRISVYSPETGKWEAAEAQSLLDEVHYRHGYQVPKEDRWALRAIESLLPKNEQQPMVEQKDPLADLREAAANAQHGDFERLLDLFMKTTPEQVEQARTLLAMAGESIREQQQKIHEELHIQKEAPAVPVVKSRLMQTLEVVPSLGEQLKKIKTRQGDPQFSHKASEVLGTANSWIAQIQAAQSSTFNMSVEP
jgi:hypothetical protein